VSFICDFSRGSSSFDINFDSPFAPSPAVFLNTANVVLDQLAVGRNITNNQENTFHNYLNYDLDFGNGANTSGSKTYSFSVNTLLRSLLINIVLVKKGLSVSLDFLIDVSPLVLATDSSMKKRTSKK